MIVFRKHIRLFHNVRDYDTLIRRGIIDGKTSPTFTSDFDGKFVISIIKKIYS
jgi:hypothetical protein